MTLREIQINFRNADSRAEQLDAIAEEMKKIANDSLMQSLERLQGGWQGESADLYVRKGMELVSLINATAKEISAAADSIRQIARNTRDAEQRAYELAQRRDYGSPG